jgi:hypothetical protein
VLAVEMLWIRSGKVTPVLSPSVRKRPKRAETANAGVGM